MKYIIKERIFTLTDKFIIEDEEGYPRYEVVGKLLSLGNKLCIYDLDGEELVYIEQKLFKLLPEYNIYQKGHLVGKVKKKITFLKPSFIIESSYGNFTLKGDILHHDFDILKDGKSVAWINKKWLSFSDTYSVEISDLVDHAFILAIVIVLDQIFYDGNNNN
ncbi:uncharacterized protein YxjI [Keratinibaculum paraultunense]|uniref:Uncharacterized protein YxjI n=1 Tax=Keratinibaculum paraultunense TaxID=1278232 RepID=A0A4R3KUK0_9FIRM|nr:LURP-one-related family protein [Keratinibaculum paraultunense]QQY79518.1 LURP-one-related family protein [Keratinibaculum paraultunense]TCS87987.1 uncharacterized protein YxjI [Keratinibaculum paraultunense]